MGTGNRRCRSRNITRHPRLIKCNRSRDLPVQILNENPEHQLRYRVREFSLREFNDELVLSVRKFTDELELSVRKINDQLEPQPKPREISVRKFNYELKHSVRQFNDELNISVRKLNDGLEKQRELPSIENCNSQRKRKLLVRDIKNLQQKFASIIYLE